MEDHLIKPIIIAKLTTRRVSGVSVSWLLLFRLRTRRHPAPHPTEPERDTGIPRLNTFYGLFIYTLL